MRTSKDIVVILKRERKKKRMSYQAIVEETEHNGEAVSLSTVKRIFGASGDTDYRYDSTLLPIARALGVEGEVMGDEFETIETKMSHEIDLEEWKQMYENRIADLWEVIHRVCREKRAIFIVLMSIIICLVAVVVYIMFDAMDGAWGIIRY